ncbi:efflux transporter outer membrane subunit [Desulfosarcina ovata]|uniref:efflux transporter outer membrane subunit n=1 Tax=Desulfosarcina ovata TaxID=83564 RepID=UPI0012D2B651|nr:efflux transporter outer membrane subunit [Desulfosarcina ovata]
MQRFDPNPDRGHWSWPSVGLWPAVLLGVALFLLSGCAPVGPDYVTPELVLPDAWQAVSPQVPSANGARLARWWQTLDDPVLSGLIRQAMADNLDVKDALSRVRETRLQRLIARSALFPGLDASGSAKLSGDDSSDTTELYSTGFDAAWELDLFGGIHRSVEAAQADINAEVEALGDVRVTLLAEVAANYIDLRTYQARLGVATRNVASMEETWSLLDALARAGMGDELAVAQARYNLESSRAGIADLEVGLAEAMHRLAVLTGQPAGSLNAELARVRPIPQASVELAVGVPADLLRQRPDIRQAERQLAAQTARIGEAEAQLYPSFTLNGSIGLEALSLGDLFAAESRIWSIGPGFSWSIFNAGSIRNQIKVQEEQQQQALINYKSTVLGALEEVENALVALDREQRKQARLEAAAQAASQAADLAQQQYTTGMTGFSDVLDAQRSQLSFEDQLVESRGAILSDLVHLYKVLGGGWQSPDDATEPNPGSVHKG